MSRSLFDNLPTIERRIRASASHIALFLDFDGTLAPIASSPEQAVMPPEARELLTRLSQHGDVTVAIISGRALADVRSRVGIDHLFYAGNHGLEISSRRAEFIHPKAAALQEHIRRLSEQMQERLAEISGVEIEQKGLTTSVHYRRVHENSVRRVIETVQEIVAGHRELFRLRMGKMVCEICPRVNWHKGSAVRWILDRLGLPKRLAIYIGDDVTDENAFAALQDGVTVRVGASPLTSAQYHVLNSSEVIRFIDWLKDKLGLERE